MKNRLFSAALLLGICSLLCVSCKKDNLQTASNAKKQGVSNNSGTPQAGTESSTPPSSGCHRSH
jgi:hypothetical protein